MKRTPSLFSLIVIVLVMAMAPAGRGANYALRTGQNGFFRTVQYSTDFSALDGSFTVEFWFRATGPGVLVNEVDAFSPNFWDVSWAEVKADGTIIIGLPGISGVAEVGKVTFNAWNHLALRYDAGSQDYSALLNGEVGQNRLSGTRTPPSVNQNQRFAYLAFGRTAGVPLANGGALPGDFDEVRVWSAALSDGDIQNNYQSTTIPSVDWLQSYWHLDDGSGGEMFDSSGHLHNGVNVGAVWVPSTLSTRGAPIIVSATPTIAEHSATVTASIDPIGKAATAYLEFGPTTNYSAATPAVQIAAQNGEVAVQFSLTNLNVGTYHYRVVATNSLSGAVTSDDQFTITNLSGFAGEVTGTNYIRSEKITRPFFTTAAITIEFSFYAKGPGVLLNEVDSLNVTRWDYSLMEILDDGTLVAGLPNVPTITGGKVEYNRWYNAVLRYDPATSALDVFLDGTKVGSSTGTRSVPWDYGSAVYFCLGRGGPDNLGGGEFFAGLFDEVRFWRTALPDSELAIIRNAIISGSQTDLFAYWSFDSLGGDVSPDKSPNQNRALFINGGQIVPSELTLKFDLRPSASTGAVTDSIGTIATLSGTGLSLDTNAIAYFEWSFGNTTNQTTPIQLTGRTNTTVQSILSGLEGGITYSYSLVVSNGAGVVRGDKVSFLKLGWAGYALSLGTNAYIRTISDQHPYFTDESITVEVWVRPKRHGVVMSETDRISASALDVSLIEILSDGSVVAGFPGVPSITLGTVNLDEWNNIVLRYSKSSLKMDGFVNGVASSASSSGDRSAGWELGRSIIYTFGKSTTTKLGSGQSMPAEWDEIRLWKNARTDQEILSTFNRKIPAGDTNLVAYYRFDDRLSIVTDYSGRTNRAQIAGVSEYVVSGAPVTLRYSPVAIAGDGTVTVQYIGTPGSSIRVESTSDFQSWTAGPTATADSLGVVSFNVGTLSDSTHRFFRFRQF